MNAVSTRFAPAAIFAALCAATLASAPAAAEDPKKQDDKKDENVLLSPTERTLDDDDKKSIRETLNKQLAKVLESCVASYPRPEFFTTLSVQFDLRKSGDLRGGYVPSGAVDSNLYVASDEERSKLEEAGSFARLVVSSDRDLERCLKKGTREFGTEVSRASGRVSAVYTVKWKGKKAKLEATTFEVTK